MNEALKKAIKSAERSRLEATFLLQIKAAGLPLPEQEVVFAPPRKWRFDFLYPDRKLAIELQGGTWIGGGHSTGQGYQRDCEKANEAALRGIHVLRFTSSDVMTGAALKTLERALGLGSPAKAQTGPETALVAPGGPSRGGGE